MENSVRIRTFHQTIHRYHAILKGGCMCNWKINLCSYCF